MVKTLNIGLRFLLELCLLVIFGYWGFNVGHNLLAKLLLGLGAPILVGIIWGVFLAPKSSMRLDMPGRCWWNFSFGGWHWWRYSAWVKKTWPWSWDWFIF